MPKVINLNFFSFFVKTTCRFLKQCYGCYGHNLVNFAFQVIEELLNYDQQSKSVYRHQWHRLDGGVEDWFFTNTAYRVDANSTLLVWTLACRKIPFFSLRYSLKTIFVLVSFLTVLLLCVIKTNIS